jgi:hypothetical protein
MDAVQLERFEALCTANYVSPHPQERAEAQQHVLCLQSSTSQL